jgi:beta-phosphoglucomutase
MFSKIKAILFDCDGTIVDSENGHYCAWKYALQKQGSDLTEEKYYSYVGSSSETIAELLSKTLGRNCAHEILKDKCDYFLELLYKGLPSIQPTLNLIWQLADKKANCGFKLGITSAASKQEILLHLAHLVPDHESFCQDFSAGHSAERAAQQNKDGPKMNKDFCNQTLGIEKIFDVIISGRDDLSDYNDPEGVNKPKPYIYIYAAKRLNVAPRECVVIEDSSSGVKAAVEAGCFTIAVPNRYSCHQDFSLANLKIESFSDINAEHFFQIVINAKKTKINRESI